MYSKYLKYKNKYLKLKNQNGGAASVEEPKLIYQDDDIARLKQT
jgi:hypothetical protein